MINSRKSDVLQFSHLLLDTLHRRVTRHHSQHSLIASRRVRHDYSSSLEIFTHDRSSSLDASLDALVTTTHRHSTHSSSSLIVSRSIRHDRLSSLETFIYDYSTLSTSARHRLKLWRINSSKLAQVFRREILSRFQTRDLLVRLVSTRYESRHSSILRLRRSIYTLSHVSRSQHN